MNKVKLFFAVLILIPLLIAALIGFRWWQARQAVADAWTNFDAHAPALATMG